MSKEEIQRAVQQLVGGMSLDEKAGDLLALVGKDKDDDLTQSDAREIGRKVAKMTGARLRKYLGMIKALGGYYKGRGSGTAKLAGIRKAAMDAYNSATKKESRDQPLTRLLQEQESPPETGGGEEEEEYFAYLDDLRTSGVTNMYGAGRYLEREFGLDKRTARAVLTKWMKTFGQRHPREGE
jgi:hypothetical protein